MGEGGVKNPGKMSTSFMDGPYGCVQYNDPIWQYTCHLVHVIEYSASLSKIENKKKILKINIYFIRGSLIHI